MKPLSSLGSDALYPRIRVSCERFPVHVRDDDGGVQAEVPAPVPFENYEPVGHEAFERFAYLEDSSVMRSRDEERGGDANTSCYDGPHVPSGRPLRDRG